MAGRSSAQADCLWFFIGGSQQNFKQIWWVERLKSRCGRKFIGLSKPPVTVEVRLCFGSDRVVAGARIALHDANNAAYVHLRSRTVPIRSHCVSDEDSSKINSTKAVVASIAPHARPECLIVAKGFPYSAKDIGENLSAQIEPGQSGVNLELRFSLAAAQLLMTRRSRTFASGSWPQTI